MGEGIPVKEFTCDDRNLEKELLSVDKAFIFLFLSLVLLYTPHFNGPVIHPTWGKRRR